MPLNKLENFIKNAEGRILYVNPNDLDSTDGVENQGNSLTKPFKTIQRALIESARFSYLRGDDNDLVEKTTILVFPGEHLIDNRPGYLVKNQGGNAIAVAPGGAEFAAQNELTLTLNSNFDLTQEDNILYKFNSVYGGIIIPRGTSIVGLDLRKTKVRPKYVPNPTDDSAPSTAIFRITGACYFWQFSFFDGDETGLVYTDPRDFSVANRSKPTFSHHKVTCFEYADGVNIPGGYELTDLDMYYSKVANAFNRASGREIDQKYPASPDAFAKQRPEWEIVGAFASDPITISQIISGDGATPSTVVTVTTQTPHGLNAGTPIKIRNINVEDYNVSTKVVQVVSDTVFTYALGKVRSNLPAGPGAGLAPGNGASVVIETDTVTGASPYIFNCSLRSVYGMQGMHADGSKADGFRSMVVAQFTAVSLQKDDRAFVKYNKTNREYTGISYSRETGDALSAESSATNETEVLHLDSDAVYRDNWKTTHIKMSNDSVIQVVSVFAIGFHKHFEALSGGDASITNSNSNFGQFSLAADGFKKEAFAKDDKGFVTGVITPKSIETTELDIEWVQFDANLITSTSASQRLYLLGYDKLDIEPPVISQGYRLGARVGDQIFLDDNGTDKGAKILMTNTITTGTGAGDVVNGNDSSSKVYKQVTISTPATSTTNTESIFRTLSAHDIQHGESIRIFSETGDLPDGLEEGQVYFAITNAVNQVSSTVGRQDGITLSADEFQLASNRTNANAGNPVFITAYPNKPLTSSPLELRVESRVSDKVAGEVGHPIQYDYVVGNWYIYVAANSDLYTYLSAQTGDSEISYFKRIEDPRSIDDKIYKLRYVVPKELENAREPISGFVLQDSSSVNVRFNSDFNKTSISLVADPANNITANEYDFDRNTRFISSCTYTSGTPGTITVRSDKPHNLKKTDIIVVKNVPSSTNTSAQDNVGFNGDFEVQSTPDAKTFTYFDKNIRDITQNPGNPTFNPHVRDKTLPTFSKNNNNENLYVYRVETIKPLIKDIQDGVYYMYVLNCNNAIVGAAFTGSDVKYGQNITDLYPQLDRDNAEDNPPAAVSFAKRTPLGEVVTNDLKRSITRESLDNFNKSFQHGNEIVGVTTTDTTATFTLGVEHGLNALTKFTTLHGGTGTHTEGTYYNVKLLDTPNRAGEWGGATAKVVVNSSGNVSSATITEGGQGYTNGETLYFDTTPSIGIGGNDSSNAGRIEISTSDILVATNDYVQVTGIGTTGGGYYRITDATAADSNNNHTKVAIAKTVGDPLPKVGEYLTVVGRVGDISGHSASTDATTNVTTVTLTLSANAGLVGGNRVRLTNASNVNLGDYIIGSVSNGAANSFTIVTKKDISAARYVMKHGMTANKTVSDGESIGSGMMSFYDNAILFTNESVTVSAGKFKVKLPDGSTTQDIIESRFPVGSYIQIGNEIMRVQDSTLQGTNNDMLQVIRGSMGTLIESHADNTQIKKIKIQPIELRRPSILRASGHTFEYLGYGPGNYSTGLPQVQVKTLTEDEEFLSQSQETTCGTVLYTGMDSDGDFYIGNTKYSAQSGEQKTFDVPTPTVTGEDPNRLSVVFDEIIVKERILVEGGKSKQILSQFDGPVNFTGTVRFSDTINTLGIRAKGKVDIVEDTDATSCTDQNAALRVAGGVAIGKQLWVCEQTNLMSSLVVHGTSTLKGVATVETSIVPDADEGATIGTAALPFSEAHIDEVRIGVSGDGEIDTATGGLTLDSASGTVTVDDNLVVTGNFDVDGDTTLDTTRIDGTLTIDGQANIDNVTINGDEVTATNFRGTADVASEAPVYGTDSQGLNSHNFALMMSPSFLVSGVVQKLHRDQNIKFNTGTNELKCAGDIIAFVSDERLKTDMVGITNALDKVNSLSGFTYTWTEWASEQGNQFDRSKRHVGVSAQEVQKVLPEAVAPAPFNEEYLTVKYDKIVPLLIEAIKELSDKVSALEDKLNK
tara:strand:+ start:416 stop:6280 length:5865 start_codon:yes stop_codon:yes gene_type:complete